MLDAGRRSRPKSLAAAGLNTHDQYDATVAVGAGDDFVVVWNSRYSAGPDNFFSIQGQRFTVSLFEDGFESGDTSRWFQ